MDVAVRCVCTMQANQVHRVIVVGYSMRFLNFAQTAFTLARNYFVQPKSPHCFTLSLFLARFPTDSAVSAPDRRSCHSAHRIDEKWAAMSNAQKRLYPNRRPSLLFPIHFLSAPLSTLFFALGSRRASTLCSCCAIPTTWHFQTELIFYLINSNRSITGDIETWSLNCTSPFAVNGRFDGR